MVKVNNVSKWASGKKYMVIRIVNGEAWFYDAWDDYGKALVQASEEGGQVVPSSEVEVLSLGNW